MNFEQATQIAIPSLRNDRVVLRPCVQSDFAAICQYRQDAQSCRYIGSPQPDGEIKALVDQHTSPRLLEVGRWNALIICQPADQTAIGEMVFRICDWQNQRAELGYRVNRRYAGQGLATEAARLMVAYLFKTIGVHKIIAQCDPRNIASFKVMEKLGMQREGHFKRHFLIQDEWTDQLDYGLLKEDWRTS